MFSNCPRCEKANLNSTGECPECGYSLREPCSECGHKNIPYAKFCGGCGRGMNLNLRIKKWFHSKISFFNRARARKFATGFSFGLIMSAFAFGSMGMHQQAENFNSIPDLPHQISMTDIESRGFFATDALLELNNWQGSQNLERKANLKDLILATNIAVKHLNSVLFMDQDKFGSSSKYLTGLQNTEANMNKDLSRGTAAQFLFSLTSDLFGFDYKNFSGQIAFKDIPKFHYLNIPAEALTLIGVPICRNSQELGMHDRLTVKELHGLLKSVILAAETKTKLSTFASLSPRN